MKEELTKVWKACETKQVGKVFEEYMKSLGVKKYNSDKRDALNTYLVDGKCTNWNRVECYYHKDSAKFGEEELELVLRKRAGDYFIVAKHGERAFEVDYGGIKHYDEGLLKEIVKEHEPLFQKLFELAS